MGYTTYFEGNFKIKPEPLNIELAEYIIKFSETRRMRRDVPEIFGEKGEFFIFGSGDFGQGRDNNIIDYNVPPITQPSLWCNWTTHKNGELLYWNGMEKFYGYSEWLFYITKNFLMPFEYYLEGTVKYQGEDPKDNGEIVCNKKEIIITTDSKFSFPSYINLEQIINRGSKFKKLFYEYIIEFSRYV